MCVGERVSGHHRLVADEPRLIGDDAGPTPCDLLLAGLGACTSMTVRMYAGRKGWPLERVRVTLRHNRIHAEDCADCETTKGWTHHVLAAVLAARTSTGVPVMAASVSSGTARSRWE